MKNIFRVFGLLLLLTQCAQAEGLYRWVDKDGRVHYGDWPAEDARATQEKKFAPPPARDELDLPYSVRKAMQDFPVTLYVAPSCGDPCADAHAFLNKRGVPFVEINLVTQAEFDEFKAKTGNDGIPVMMVGNTVMKGFAADRWNAELDIAGYPRTAPYGSRPVPPSVTPPAASVPPENPTTVEK